MVRPPRAAPPPPPHDPAAARSPPPPQQDAEVQEAVAGYLEALAEVDAALAADPGDAEAAALRAELAAALADARGALPPGDADGAAAAPAIGPAPAPPPPPPPEALAPSRRPRALPYSGSGNASSAPLNARIHPRSLYAAAEPDFAALARHHPPLAPFLRRGAAAAASAARASLDFSDAAACRALTAALLKVDYGVEWALPAGHLAPPVTVRANYVHWLQDLLALAPPPAPGVVVSEDGAEKVVVGGGGAGNGAGRGPAALSPPALTGPGIVGLDIGTGASLIYPLLGAAVAGWRFVAVDVTRAALAGAAANRAANPRLAPLLELRAARPQPAQRAALGADAALGDDEDPSSTPAVSLPLPGVLAAALRPGERFAFSMCNPPFFESAAEAGANPATAYGGTPAEVAFPGGEAAFVASMVEDSFRLGEAVHWYTTMVGKKATLKAMRAMLTARGARTVRTAEFAQGRTARWGLAWSLARGAAAAAAAGAPLPRPAAPGDTPAAAALAPVRGRRAAAQVFAPAAAGVEVLAVAADALRRRGLAVAVDAAAFSLRAAEAPGGAKRARIEDGGGGGSAAAAAPTLDSTPFSLELTLFAQPGGGGFALTCALARGCPDTLAPRFAAAAAAARAALAARWRVI
jgi:23S rRNA (adenine1618-N6)-methyltransferase